MAEIFVEPGDSIADAVAIAKPGDTIILKTGSYPGTARVTKENVTIRSEPMNNSWLDDMETK